MANTSSLIFAVAALILVQNSKYVSTTNDGVKIISWKGIEELKADTTLTPDVGNECLKSTVCKRVSNYPTKIAKWALEQLKEKNTVEKLDRSTVNHDVTSMACETSQEIVYPKAAKSSTGKWDFILNSDDKTFQGFYTNRCVSGECSQLRDPRNSECEQEYTLRSMIYLDMENERVASKLFKVPTRCSCKITCSYW